MIMKANKWHCCYVEEYLAIGEAPEQVRNCFQQRSRWCKVLPPIAQLCLLSFPVCYLSWRQHISSSVTPNMNPTRKMHSCHWSDINSWGP